jgi:hypothetical protein
MSLLRVLGIAAFGASGMLALASGCGARTDLGAPLEDDAASEDGKVDHHDATEEDAAEEDAIPHIDQFVDAPIPTDCPDAGSTLVYVVTAENDLYSFYPPTLAFSKIGTIACPNTKSTPYSMAVDRKGTAFSVFADGTLWQISTANAACKATSYVPSPQGTPFFNFGMGFVGTLTTDTLYVCDANFGNVNSKGLADIDTTTFKRNFVANFQPELPRCELTGTGDGRLFAFCLLTSGGSEIAEIDPQTAKVIAVNQLKVGNVNDAFAYSFWGGYFWIFHGPGGNTTVVQYDPQTFAETNVTTLNRTIVGAGVSTCAPQ